MLHKRRSIALAFLIFIGFVIYINLGLLASSLEYNKTTRSKTLDVSHLVKIDYIHMEPESFRLFAKHLIGKRQYLEWGAGGSTQLAPYIVSGKAYSIEHVPEWCYHLRSENELVRTAVELGKLEIVCVNHPVKLGDWGYPSTNTSLAEIKDLNHRYVDAVDGIHTSGVFDFVLIDGRFRVACALSLLMKGLVNRESKVMIHDFHRRPHYVVVLQFYDIVEHSSDESTAIVLTPKATIDENRLRREYHYYEHDYQ